MAITKKDKSAEIVIEAPREASITVNILGTQPLIYNRMSEKAKRALLGLAEPKIKGKKHTTLKHDPLAEYRDSVNAFRRDEDRPTRLWFPVSSVKAAMRSAALDTPDLAKSEVGRLVWVEGLDIPVYGVPQVFMCAVKSAGMNRTPDIRTRAILPQWAMSVTVRFASPPLTQNAIVNLLARAGRFIGLGDFRQEKGAGSFGQFEIVGEDDPRFLEVVANGGRAAQDDGLEEPQAYDYETEELLSFFEAEVERRGLRAIA